MKKLTTENFIEKSNIVHNFEFDYSLVNYIYSSSKVIIICKLHGSFLQTPASHLMGIKCPNCSNKKKMTTVSFAEKANKIYENKFNYNKVVYINNWTKVTITCPIHGDFFQKPNNHLSGQSCYECGKIKKRDIFSDTTDIFIRKANKIHNFKFDYSLVKYINTDTIVEIICIKHGIFSQKPNAHLQGYGCNICNESSGETSIRKILQKLDITFKSQFKIKECKNKNPLPFDFAIFENKKLKMLIEFQGKQHYNPVSFGSKNKYKIVENFKITQCNDNIKKQFCEINNIPLLIIPYWDKKNIKEILETKYVK